MDSTQLYLDLMKKALSYSLWEEPGLPIEHLLVRYPFYSKALYRLLSNIFALRGLQIVRKRKLNAADKEQGKYWPRLADTMIGLKRLDNIQFCVESVLRENIEGDFIETGVWRGGACI